MNTKIVIPIIVFALIIGGFLLLKQKDASEQTSSANNFFDLELQDYNRDIILLADFKGKPIVINSWAAWCPFCRKELVDFTAVQKEFENQITIIAIDRAEPLETAKKYSDELGVTNNLIFLLDPSDSFYQSIGGFSMPETIFVDKNGKIVEHKRGPMARDEIKQKVEKLLSMQ